MSHLRALTQSTRRVASARLPPGIAVVVPPRDLEANATLTADAPDFA